MTVKFEGERAHDQPKRFVWMALDFQITGDVEDKVVAARHRALAHEVLLGLEHHSAGRGVDGPTIHGVQQSKGTGPWQLAAVPTRTSTGCAAWPCSR